MFFFFHLFTGIVLGLLIGDLISDRRWIIPCVIGAILPDVIDKPLNFIVFPAINGAGRFLFHNLLVLIVLTVIGFLVWNYYRSPVILALDIGILSHQILDSMWTEPVRWLYPLLGPSPAEDASAPDFIISLLEKELFNPSEWIMLILLGLGLLAYFKYRHTISTSPATRSILKGALMICTLICCLLGGFLISRGLGIDILGRRLNRLFMFFTGYGAPLDYLMGGVVIILAAYVSWRFYRNINGAKETE